MLSGATFLLRKCYLVLAIVRNYYVISAPIARQRDAFLCQLLRSLVFPFVFCVSNSYPACMRMHSAFLPPLPLALASTPNLLTTPHNCCVYASMGILWTLITLILCVNHFVIQHKNIRYSLSLLPFMFVFKLLRNSSHITFHCSYCSFDIYQA